MRYFREKLQRRNVTQDVKHYEDCEQLFMSVDKCFTIEALVHFFGMTNKEGRITKNRPPYHILDVGDTKQEYFYSKLNRFIDDFHLLPSSALALENENELSYPDGQDFVKNYSLCLLKYYLILLDYKDAVKEGNGERLATLHKVLVPYFKSLPSFNAYAIEMLINVVQNKVFLSEAECHHCMWASTANWKGGSGKNIEIDLLQESRNKAHKKAIKSMGANKTDRAIERSSKSCGGERHTVENFDSQVNKVSHSSSHSHKSSAADEEKVTSVIRELKPFNTEANRKHDSFQEIMADPLATLNLVDLDKWLRKHQRNLLLDAPLLNEDEPITD